VCYSFSLKAKRAKPKRNFAWKQNGKMKRNKAKNNGNFISLLIDAKNEKEAKKN
jgi:hypothetical protein